MEIFYQGCEVAATIIETYIFLDFLTRFLGRKYSNGKQILVLGLVFICINGFMICMNFLIPQYSAFQDIGVLLMYTAYALFCSSGTRIMKTITPALTITSILAINLLTAFLLSSIWQVSVGELVIDRNGQRIIALVITKALFFVGTRVVIRLFKPKEIILSLKEYIAVALSFICSVIIIVYFAEVQFHSAKEAMDLYTVCVLFSVVLINIASSILFAVLVKQNRERTQHMVIEIQFKEQQKMYQSICSAYKNLEILQHDMKNDLLSLQALIHKGETDEAEKFVERYTKTKLEQFQIYVRTGYELIDAIVNIKLNYAREMGIDVLCQITADFTCFETEDIVSIFSNAIDNAIESSVQQTKRYISVVMENKRDYLHIAIGNAIHASVLEKNAKLLTTKKEKKYHGFGTQSMLHVVEKYDGMIEYYENNSVFYVDILLKHTKQERKTTKHEISIDI